MLQPTDLKYASEIFNPRRNVGGLCYSFHSQFLLGPYVSSPARRAFTNVHYTYAKVEYLDWGLSLSSTTDYWSLGTATCVNVEGRGIARIVIKRG